MRCRGSRWLRLLFAREFHMLDVLRLWDAIFADDEQLGMVDYMALSMLLFLRENCANGPFPSPRALLLTHYNAVVAADYMMCLNRLMRFPPVEDVLTIFERAMQIRELPEVRLYMPAFLTG